MDAMWVLTRSVLMQSSAERVTDSALTGADWLQTGLILVATVIVAVVANRLLRAGMVRWVGSGFASILTARLLSYLVFLLGLFYALNSLGVRLGPLLGALGLGGLVLALALQKVAENFVAAVILQTRRPFTVGETVTIHDRTGVVMDIDSRTTVLAGLDGTIVRIPNITVISETITNLTRQPARRSRLRVGVSYETDLEQAAQALRNAIARVPRVLSEPPPLVALDSFGESSIDFDVYYWHASDIASEVATRHDLVLAVHQTLTLAGITIAFPQLVVWSGQPSDDPTYTDVPTTVRSLHPSADGRAGKKAGTRQRRSGRAGGGPGFRYRVGGFARGRSPQTGTAPGPDPAADPERSEPE